MDLAGNEDVGYTARKGGKSINIDLYALRSMFDSLGKSKHIQCRDSKIAELLPDVFISPRKPTVVWILCLSQLQEHESLIRRTLEFPAKVPLQLSKVCEPN